MLHVNVDRYHTTNRTATTNGPISLACAAGLGKYGYGNGFTVMERTYIGNCPRDQILDGKFKILFTLFLYVCI